MRISLSLKRSQFRPTGLHRILSVSLALTGRLDFTQQTFFFARCKIWRTFFISGFFIVSRFPSLPKSPWHVFVIIFISPLKFLFEHVELINFYKDAFLVRIDFFPDVVKVEHPCLATNCIRRKVGNLIRYGKMKKDLLSFAVASHLGGRRLSSICSVSYLNLLHGCIRCNDFRQATRNFEFANIADSLPHVSDAS